MRALFAHARARRVENAAAARRDAAAPTMRGSDSVTLTTPSTFSARADTESSAFSLRPIAWTMRDRPARCRTGRALAGDDAVAARRTFRRCGPARRRSGPAELRGDVDHRKAADGRPDHTALRIAVLADDIGVHERDETPRCRPAASGNGGCRGSFRSRTPARRASRKCARRCPS